MTLVFIKFVFSMNLFRIVHCAVFQRRSLVPIRWADWVELFSVKQVMNSKDVLATLRLEVR